MNKSEFLNQLEARLSGLPKEDIYSRTQFYSEMIDDRVEDGLTEEQAVAEIGSIDEVVETITKDTPLIKLVKEKVTPKRKIGAFEIVLIVLGFPLWFPLLLTFFILCLVAYLLLWVGMFVTYAVNIAFFVGAFWSLAVYFPSQNIGFLGIFFLGIGLGIFTIFISIAVTKGTIALTKAVALSIKRKIVRG